ncbi:hypothetical protein FOA52_001389 [Chlamydomonas sp. UWO 241]|nr:hypothetical protein FOA52_001389 [Chlamydomonas sp. UWO 241]
MSTTTLNSLPWDVLRLIGTCNPAMIAVCQDVYVALRGDVANKYDRALAFCGDNASVVIAAGKWGVSSVLRYALHLMPKPGANTLPDEAGDKEAEDYLLSEWDCRSVLAEAVHGAIVGGNVQCVRLILASARPWLSTVEKNPIEQHTHPIMRPCGNRINVHIHLLLSYCCMPDPDPSSIDPAILKVINDASDTIERPARRLKELKQVKDIEEYAEVAEFW